jgi:hypothetical protein
MKFGVLSCVETDHELIVSLRVDEEARQYLINRGFCALLEDVIKKIEESDERETPEGI